MDLNEPLPRLLRLRGMVVRSVPGEDAKLGQTDAHALTDAYIRLREAVRKVALDLGESEAAFDGPLPAKSPLTQHVTVGPSAQSVVLASAATDAASLLRALAGYIEGLIETVVLEQKISMEQVQAAREAARQPPGFR
jgi:hypothetical protein